MADSIGVVQIKAFSDLVIERAQQKESLTRPWCEVKTGVTGESVSFDRIGLVEMVPKASRNAPTPDADPNHERRWAQLAAFHSGIFIDPTDLPTLGYDPTSKYVTSLSNAMGRQWDRWILTAALATAITGRIGEAGASGTGATGTETWPITDRIGVSHQIAAAASGVTPAKLRQAKRILDTIMVGRDRVIFIDAFAIQQMLSQPEITSADYNTVRALVNGEIDSWLGMKWEMVDPTLMTYTGTLGASPTMSAVIMERGAIGLAVGLEQNIDVLTRTDRSNSKQAYASMMGGAVRRDGERIVELQYVAS